MSLNKRTPCHEAFHLLLSTSPPGGFRSWQKPSSPSKPAPSSQVAAYVPHGRPASTGMIAFWSRKCPEVVRGNIFFRIHHRDGIPRCPNGVVGQHIDFIDVLASLEIHVSYQTRRTALRLSVRPLKRLDPLATCPLHAECSFSGPVPY